jgi:hypothetical protein
VGREGGVVAISEPLFIHTSFGENAGAFDRHGLAANADRRESQPQVTSPWSAGRSLCGNDHASNRRTRWENTPSIYDDRLVEYRLK